MVRMPVALVPIHESEVADDFRGAALRNLKAYWFQAVLSSHPHSLTLVRDLGLGTQNHTSHLQILAGVTGPRLGGCVAEPGIGFCSPKSPSGSPAGATAEGTEALLRKAVLLSSPAQGSVGAFSAGSI